MGNCVELTYLNGQLAEVLTPTVKTAVVTNLLRGEPPRFVQVSFPGQTRVSAYLEPVAAESLFWQLAEIYSPVSVSKLRLIASSPSKMAEEGVDHGEV